MDDTAVIVLRMLERLLIVSFGGMAIYLGYKLFFHLPTERDDSGQLELPGMKVVLTKAGPGVFFLAFGAFILISGNSGIKVESSAESSSIAAANEDTTRRSFAGASSFSGKEKNTFGLESSRAAVIEQVGELNCLYELAASETNIATSITIAFQNAKLAMLRPVWDEQSWGDISILEKGSEGENKNIKGIFNDKSTHCQI